MALFRNNIVYTIIAFGLYLLIVLFKRVGSPDLIRVQSLTAGIRGYPQIPADIRKVIRFETGG
jgi:hypothetical protein